jgi:hypothetical protein
MKRSYLKRNITREFDLAALSRLNPVFEKKWEERIISLRKDAEMLKNKLGGARIRPCVRFKD